MESFLFNYRLGNDFDIFKNTISGGLFELFTGGVDGVDGRSIKSVLQFSLSIFIWFLKNHAKSKVFQNAYDNGPFFQKLMSSGGVGFDFKNYHFRMIFFKLCQKYGISVRNLEPF